MQMVTGEGLDSILSLNEHKCLSLRPSLLFCGCAGVRRPVSARRSVVRGVRLVVSERERGTREPHIEEDVKSEEMIQEQDVSIQS